MGARVGSRMGRSIGAAVGSRVGTAIKGLLLAGLVTGASVMLPSGAANAFWDRISSMAAGWLGQGGGPSSASLPGTSVPGAGAVSSGAGTLADKAVSKAVEAAAAMSGTMGGMPAQAVQKAGRAPATQPTAFAAGAGYTLCFTPDGPSCEQLLVRSINQARSSVLVQAYSFTNKSIAQAVAQAHARGLDVRVILDKSQRTEKYTAATYLRNHGVRVWIDQKPAIAHNKVMIIDQQHVFTGSYNFSSSAEIRNTENGILISRDPNITKRYTDNWIDRVRVSERI